MKNKYDPRHLKRIKDMQAIFAWGLSKTESNSPHYIEITSHLDEIDRQIEKNAPKWPLDKINKVDLAILRCAFWELTYQPNTPAKVVIDEAVELAKEFGNEGSSPFINGVLGSALKNEPTQS